MLNEAQCPVGTVHPIIGHSCPTGHYCPVGTILPIGCAAGTYQDIEAQGACKPCPIGHYCYNTTSHFEPNICPGGYYCPVGSEQPYQYPCPAGTFNNLTAQHDIGACLSCTAGKYCEGLGNADPTGPCDAGWYCTNGSNSARVCIMFFNRFIFTNLIYYQQLLFGFVYSAVYVIYKIRLILTKSQM